MEKLRNIIRESVLKVLAEGTEVLSGLVDSKGTPIRTGRMARPVDTNDKRWGKIAGVTIDLKVRMAWSDPESKRTGGKETAVDPKSIEIY